MPLVILQYLYSLQIKGDSQKRCQCHIKDKEAINSSQNFLFLTITDIREIIHLMYIIFLTFYHLCGLMVRVLGYRSGGTCSIPGTTRKIVVGLERGTLSLVSTTEEILDRKVAAPVYKTENMAVGIRHADHVALSIRKSWQSLRRQAAVARSV
jgi:hypothetical protein